MTAEVELSLHELGTWVTSAWQTLRDGFLLPGEYIVTVSSEHVHALAGETAYLATYTIVCSAIAWLCCLLVMRAFLRFACRQLLEGYYTTRRGAAARRRMRQPVPIA